MTAYGWWGPAGLQPVADDDAPRPRCKCSHGPSTHTGGYGRCWQMPCCCETYREKAEK